MLYKEPKKMLNVRLEEVYFETLDFYKKETGTPYTTTIKRALDYYYANHGRGSKIGIEKKKGIEPGEEEEIVSVPDPQ